MAENTEHTAETSIPFADDDADDDKDNIDATGQGKCLEHQDQTDSPVSNGKASVQQESPTKNGRKPEGDNASSANKLSSHYCFSEQKATGRSLVSHTTSYSNLQLSKELNKNVNPLPSRSHLPVTEIADTTCDDVSRSNAEKENRDSDQSQDSKFYHNDFQHSAIGGENTSLTGKNLPEVGEQPVRKPSVHGEEILNAMNQNQHIKKLASEAEKIRGGNAGTVETSTDKEGLMESLLAEMGNLTITEMEAAGEGSGNTTQAAVHETKMDNGEIITERKVSPFLDVIIEYAKQQKKTDNLFPGVEVSFQNQGSDLWCTLTRKENVPESICNEILNLDSNYGTRDVKFSDIDILSMVVNKERMIEALLAEIRLKENFHGKVDSVSQKIFIVASDQPKADSIYFKIKKGLSMKTFALHGEMKQKLYVEKLINAIENASSGKVEGKLDSCGMIIKIVGVQSSVETAVTDFKPVAETCVVTCPDIIKFIERKFGKATAMSDGNLVQVESQAENEKTVFVLHGPSEQVSCLHKNIEALKVACAVKIVNITDTEMLSYLTNNAGDEFLNNLTTRHDVIVEKNEVAKEALSDVLLEKTHTFSVGHKVSLARFLPDYLQKEPKVTFQAYEDSEHQVDMNSEETVTVTIPKYNEGKTKEKSNFEESMKKLIKWMEKNSVTKISLCLEKTGGWPFGKLVKSVLYGLKNYMDKALSVPSSVCLFPDDVTNYEEVEKAFDGAFSDTTFDNSHFEDNASQDGLKVDVWNTDLLDKQADVLVCPVHPELDLKEGVISAHLLARAGPKLQDELIRNACKKKLKPWEFVCTEGYNSPYKYILHGALEKRKDKQSDKAIQNFIYRCLQKAHELEAASIVFPALGTGRCEYRPEYIAAAIYEAAMFFEMNNPATVLKEVNIASNHDATLSVMCPQLQTRHCSNLMKVGRVLVRVMLVKMGLTAVMADSVTVFWEKGNRSKRDKIYDGDNDKMIKIRYSGNEVNLEPAFQDGIREANRHRCQSCILYFRKTDAMMSYKEKTVQHLLKAIENLSEELSYIRCIAVVFEDDELSLLHWFERNCKASASAATVQQITETKKLSTVQRVVKFIGHPKNVEEAVKEFEDISAQLQNQVSPFVQPPFEQTISRDERGPHDNLKEKEYVGDSYGSSEEVTKRDTQTQPDHLRPHESAKMVCEVTKNMAGDEQNKIEHSDEPDSKKTDTWDFTMLTHDEKDCLYVEVRNIDGAVNFRTLSKIIQKSQIPIRIPNLIYPFENKQKALLICQTQEDAELLDGYKHEESKLMFEKFKPQCLQKIKIAIPEKSINCLRENGQLENCLQHLEEIGVVEHPEPNYLPATSVFVTVFTMPQVQILLDILQVYNNTRYEKPRPITSSLVDTQKKYLRSDDLGLQNNENKSSSKSDAVHVETIGNVSELSWKVFCKQRSCEIEKLKEQNIYIYFSKDCIYIYGHTDESSIDKIKKDFDKLTKLQFEEIKPVKEGREAEYVQWCSDASDAVGKECCIYDEERKSFIAFGEDYDNIVKIKHQLNIKQDVIKQTGRRRHRHFDTSPKLPDTDSGLSHESSALESMSFAKQKSLDFSWTKDVSQKQEYTTNEGIKVYVYVADILRLPVDCIVNAANSTLKHGGGVAFAIAKAAGQKLTDDGDEYISSNGPVPVGMACTTTAGNLPYACVIHAVGPRWSDYSPYNVINIKDCESHLQNAILSSFSEAEKKKLKSIALPAVSSAIFAVPEDMCAVQYAKAILNYSSGSSIKSDILKEIHFVDKNPNIIRLIQDTFKTMIEDNKTTDYDKMKYVTDKNTINRDLPGFVESPDGCEIIAKNGSKVYFYHGSILKAYRKRISCIVCANDHSGRGLGELANGLARRAQGFEYHKYKSAAFQKVKHVRAGQVVVSAGQGTGYMTVIHAVLWSPEPVADQRVVIQRVYQNVFSEIASRQLSNAAMPPLKTESVSLEHSIEAFIDAYLDFCSTSKSVRKLDIHFVCKSNAENNLAVDLMRTRLQKDDILPDPFRNKSEVYSPDPVDEKEEMKTLDNSCVICMDKISVPKSLPCGHVFCTGCIDNYHENYKQVCPTCGKVCGIIIGDQPDGKMYVVTQRYFHCAGYENNGRIDVTYTFPGGRQKEIHPEPGKYYSGISRTAYLPDNKEGREILELLHIAFERKLIFTIGRSRTTGKEGVITWNDIHHKTNPNPHTTFGYPDPGYFERVRNELADKGVTVNDIENEHQHKGRSDMTQEYESKNKRNI